MQLIKDTKNYMSPDLYINQIRFELFLGRLFFLVPHLPLIINIYSIIYIYYFILRCGTRKMNTLKH